MGLVVLTAVFSAGPASAHADEAAGAYTLNVGWGTEPTFAGFPNSATATITNTATGEPVTDLGDTLQVEVSTGDQKQSYPLEAKFEVGEFGEPGLYGADLIPNRPGTYTFHFTGTINGQAVDTSVTSGADTFSDVANSTEAQFPAKDDPSIGDVAQKVDAVSGRIENATTAAQNAQSEAKKAKDDASSTKTIAIIALVIGAVGVVLGGVSLARKRQ